MKKGFTIVELLLVVGIIGILMGIITTAASSSMRSSRKQRADALCSLVQAGLATYHAQKGEWPISFSGTRSNNEGTDNNSDPDIIELTGSEVRQCVKALVDETKKGNPMMDISGLWVSRSPGEPQGTGGSGTKGNNLGQQRREGYGMDFMTAIRGSRKSSKKMTTAEMYFGYPDPETGAFLRFKMTYSRPSDSITVKKHWD